MMSTPRYIQVLLPLRLKWDPFYSCDAGISLERGDRVKVGFAGKEYVGVVTKADASVDNAKLDLARVKPIAGLADNLARVTEEELEFWEQLADYYLCTVGEVYKASYPAGKVDEEQVKARIRERLMERLRKKEEQIAKARKEETKTRYEKERDTILSLLHDGGSSTHEAEAPELSPEQTVAYSRIKEVFEKNKPALLQGVTGSGKTEIYLKFAKETLDNGRNVLFMVPEIALSRQLEERLRDRFPTELQVFHSAETAARRAEVAGFIRQRPYLVLGTRSSIFLPHRDLGLVILDEEHDSSYKQDNPAPRYNGRDAAIMLASIFGARVLLGSATPSLESLYNSAAGRFSKVELDKRYFDAEDSDVEIIDTIAERKKNGMVGDFSRKLIERIHATLNDGGQVAILRERRSYSPVVQCQECGSILKCKRCDVALSLHKRQDGSDYLVCHYCGKVHEYTGRCPECGGSLQPFGAGTQKIEEEAKALFPEARIARLDSDNRKQEAEVIKEFADGNIDILVGTRMVAKGFDFSGLSLVAILQADSLLGQQDYKADERAMQLLEQFRGRCGRRSEKGLFVIQTAQPDHPVYKSIIDGSKAESPVQRFLSERKMFGYPPYSRIVNAVVRDYNPGRVELMSREFVSALRLSGLGKNCSIVGPYSPPVDKIARENIRIVRILIPKDRRLKVNKTIIADTVETFEKERKYMGHISLDVDPV